MTATSGEIRVAVSGLADHASSLRDRSAVQTERADEVARHVRQLAGAWASPRGHALREDGEELVRLHGRAAQLLEQAAGEVDEVRRRGDDVVLYVRSLERRAAEARRRMELELAASGGFPTEPGIRDRLWAAQDDHRAAESQLACARGEWLSLCDGLASRLAAVQGQLDRLGVSDRFGRGEAEAFAADSAGWAQGHRGGFGSTGPRPGVGAAGVWVASLVEFRLRYPDRGDAEVTRLAAATLADRLRSHLDEQLRDGVFDAATITTVEALLRDEHLAVLLLEELGAEWLTTLAFRIESAVGQPLPRERALDDPARAVELLEGGGRLLDALAGGLTLASRRPDLDPDFVDGLVASAYDVAGAAYGLSVLLHRGGTMGPRFARTVATGIHDVDRDGSAAELWGFRAVLVDGTRASALGPPGSWDPMTGVAAMLARDVPTAQSFLLDPDPHHGTRVADLTTRDWSLADGGAAFGALVVKAAGTVRDAEDPTAAPGTADSPGARSARIASLFLGSVELSSRHRLANEGFEVPAATLLGVYLWDVQRALSDALSADPAARGVSPPGTAEQRLPASMQAWGIDIGQTRVLELLAALEPNADAFARLLAAEETLTVAQVQVAVRELEDGDQALPVTEQLQDVAFRSSAVLMAWVETRNRVATDAAAARDAQHDLLLVAGADVVGGAAVVTPLLAGAVEAGARLLTRALPRTDHERQAARAGHEAANDAEWRALGRIEAALEEHDLEDVWRANETAIRRAIRTQRQSIRAAVAP